MSKRYSVLALHLLEKGIDVSLLFSQTGPYYSHHFKSIRSQLSFIMPYPFSKIAQALSFIHHDVFPLKVRREKNAGLHTLYARHLPNTIQERL